MPPAPEELRPCGGPAPAGSRPAGHSCGRGPCILPRVRKRDAPRSSPRLEKTPSAPPRRASAAVLAETRGSGREQVRASGGSHGQTPARPLPAPAKFPRLPGPDAAGQGDSRGSHCGPRRGAAARDRAARCARRGRSAWSWGSVSGSRWRLGGGSGGAGAPGARGAAATPDRSRRAGGAGAPGRPGGACQPLARGHVARSRGAEPGPTAAAAAAEGGGDSPETRGEAAAAAGLLQAERRGGAGAAARPPGGEAGRGRGHGPRTPTSPVRSGGDPSAARGALRSRAGRLSPRGGRRGPEPRPGPCAGRGGGRGGRRGREGGGPPGRAGGWGGRGRRAGLGGLSRRRGDRVAAPGSARRRPLVSCCRLLFQRIRKWGERGAR